MQFILEILEYDYVSRLQISPSQNVIVIIWAQRQWALRIMYLNSELVRKKNDTNSQLNRNAVRSKICLNAKRTNSTVQNNLFRICVNSLLSVNTVYTLFLRLTWSKIVTLLFGSYTTSPENVKVLTRIHGNYHYVCSMCQ